MRLLALLGAAVLSLGATGAFANGACNQDDRRYWYLEGREHFGPDCKYCAGMKKCWAKESCVTQCMQTELGEYREVNKITNA